MDFLDLPLLLEEVVVGEVSKALLEVALHLQLEEVGTDMDMGDMGMVVMDMVDVKLFRMK